MTHQQILRAGGAVPLRNGGFIFSEDAFKRVFSVGSIISFGPGRTKGKITAMGETRFLYKVTRHNGEFTERVGTMRSMCGWSKP